MAPVSIQSSENFLFSVFHQYNVISCHCFDQKRGILERLEADEVILGDGGFVFALEKRGYVKAGPWTPEAVLEHPEAGKTKRLQIDLSNTKF